MNVKATSVSDVPVSDPLAADKFAQQQLEPSAAQSETRARADLKLVARQVKSDSQQASAAYCQDSVTPYGGE